MNKVILVALLLVVANSVSALTIEGGYGIGSGSTKVSEANLSYSNVTASYTNDKYVREEVGYTLNIDNFGKIFSVNGAVGESNFGKSHTTYSVTPKVSYSLGNSGVSVFGSYKYRNATSAAIADETRTSTVGVDYSLTKNIGVGAKVFNEEGDTHLHGAIVTTSVSF